MENKAIPDSAIQSGSGHTSFDTSPSDARLGSAGGWCGILNAEVYLKVDLRFPHVICAIGTQGHSNGNEEYVETFKIELALKDFKWEYYKENGAITVCILTLYTTFNQTFPCRRCGRTCLSQHSPPAFSPAFYASAREHGKEKDERRNFLCAPIFSQK